MTSHRVLPLVALLVALAGCGSRTTDEASFDTEVASDAGVDLLGKDAVDATAEAREVALDAVDVPMESIEPAPEAFDPAPETADTRVDADPGQPDPGGSPEGDGETDLCECTPETAEIDCATDDQCLVWSCVQCACVSSPRTCDDGDPCSIDSCSPDTGCHSVWPPFPCDPCDPGDSSSCYDGLACTIDDCVPCPAANPDCTAAGFTCSFKPYACADGDNCTSDICLGDTNGDGVGDCDNSPVTCDDGNACTADSCNPVNGQCEHASVEIPDDGDACTDDYCNPLDGVVHPPLECEPQGPCSISWCEPGTGCVSVTDCEQCSHLPFCGCPDDSSCRSTNKCLVGKCVNLGGPYDLCAFAPILCEPIPCQQSLCDPLEGCVYQPEPVDDGDPCTEDACDPATDQVRHEPVDCNDQDPCTDDACDSDTGDCTNAPKNCDDQDRCTIDACDPEATTDDKCTHVADSGDDGNDCTVDLCTQADGVTHVFTCDDHDACTLDLCVDKACVHEQKACDDQNLCTVDTCDPATGLCSHAPVEVDDYSECTLDFCDPATGEIVHDAAFGSDDGNACTLDECTPDGWLHRPVEVDDQNLCTEDGCSTKLGVFHTPVVCTPPNPCYLTHCEPDVGCVAPTPKDCGDADPCTIDACDPASGLCTHTIVSSDDGSPCTVDTCDPATGAMFHMPVPVDDGNACTLDSCDPPTGLILHLAVEVDDANRCTYDVCNPKKGVFHNPIVCLAPDLCHTAGCDPIVGCLAPVANDCDDHDPCTDDGCDPATGLCQYEPLGCDDGDACTYDACVNPTGCEHETTDCDDGNPCTDDLCDPSAGCVPVANTVTVGCYSGPIGSDGVGPCRGGTQTCWLGVLGPCEGDVTPSPEACNGADDDCTGAVDDEGDALCAPHERCAGSDGCVCKPECTGKTCGDDGCGSTCGTCPTGMACEGGVCLQSDCTQDGECGAKRVCVATGGPIGTCETSCAVSCRPELGLQKWDGCHCKPMPTNVLHCFNGYALDDCATITPGQDYYGQDGHFYAEKGTLAYQVAPDGTTVTDQRSGWTWARQALTGKTWAQAVSACAGNEAGLAGSGWRLPGPSALIGLADYSKYRYTGHCAVSDVFSTQCPPGHWTSTLWSAETAYEVRHLNEVYVQPSGNLDEPNSALCALPNPTVSNEIGPTRLAIKHDGNVVDRVTGLEWDVGPAAPSLNWKDALKTCSDRGEGWRLPDVKELMSLVDYDRFGENKLCRLWYRELDAIKGPPCGKQVWSSTPSRQFEGPWAFVVTFNSGTIHEYGIGVLRETWCVRPLP